MTEAKANQVVCANCQHTLMGKYCSNCGEKEYTLHDRKMTHLVEEGAHFITHLDGSFFNTLKAVFTSPGKLSTDYCAGIRKKYFKPVSFFLLLVVIYLLFPVFEGLNQKLMYYQDNIFYGKYSTQKIHHVMQVTGLSMQQIQEQFHLKGEKVSKFLLLITIPLSALFLYAATFKKRPLFFDQVIFATEVNIFYMLWGYLLLPALTFLAFYIIRLVTTHNIDISDRVLGITVYMVFAIYVARAAGKFYALKRLQSIGIAIIFIFAHLLILQIIYKFLLFQLIIWQVH